MLTSLINLNLYRDSEVRKTCRTTRALDPFSRHYLSYRHSVAKTLDFEKKLLKYLRSLDLTKTL